MYFSLWMSFSLSTFTRIQVAQVAPPSVVADSLPHQLCSTVPTPPTCPAEPKRVPDSPTAVVVHLQQKLIFLFGFWFDLTLRVLFRWRVESLPLAAKCQLLPLPALQCYVAHAGDSRCVLCRAGRAVQLTRDHKPGLPSEYARIIVSMIRSWLACLVGLWLFTVAVHRS